MRSGANMAAITLATMVNEMRSLVHLFRLYEFNFITLSSFSDCNLII